MVKQGHRGPLDALCFAAADMHMDVINLTSQRVRFGDAPAFEMNPGILAAPKRRAALNYAIRHRKTNDRTAPKVLECKVPRPGTGDILRLAWRHSIQSITARVYRDGTSQLEIVAFGIAVDAADFGLVRA